MNSSQSIVIRGAIDRVTTSVDLDYHGRPLKEEQ